MYGLDKAENFIEFKNGKSIKPGGEGIYPVYGANGIIGMSDEYREENSVIIGRVGAYCGTVQFCRGRYWASDNTIVAYPKDDNTDVGFLYYVSKNANLNRWAGGAAQPLMTQTVIKQIDLPHPDIDIQKKISAILSAYDDLIENNSRRIKILEEMACTIYQEWFVKFRFPGHEKVMMVDSPLGKIPEGWRVNKIFDITNVNYGKNLSRKYLSDDGMYLVYGAAKVIGRYDKYNCEVPAVITGCRGSCGIMKITKPKSFVTNNSFIFDFQEHEKLFYHHQLIERGLDDCIGGTAQPQITLESISSVKLFEPTNKLLKQFYDVSQPIFNQIDLLDDKNNILRQTRDLLLPKLISGEIDVEDLDIDVGELAE